KPSSETGRRKRVLRVSTLAWLLSGSFVAGGAAGLASRLLKASDAAGAPAQSSPARPQSRAPVPYTVAETLLDGKLGAGWEDWGWGRHELGGDKPPRLVFGGYGGIVLRRAELSGYFGALVFRYRAPASFENFLEVALKYEQLGENVLPKLTVTPAMVADLENGWKEVLVPWSALNPKNSPIDRVVIRAYRAVGNDWVDFDKVFLTKPDPNNRTAAPARPAALAVDCSTAGARINPLIYGIARPMDEGGETAHRHGGNVTSRLNWDLGAWNTGNDWYFENQPGEGPGSVWKWLDTDAKRGIEVAMVVPILGWVAKDGTSVGFPRSKFGEQRAFDPNRPEAGDGHDPSGKELKPGPPTQTSIPAPPELIRKWITEARDRDRARGSRGIDMYILDNEPNLWNSTHRDVHPEPLTYDELLDKTIRYASVIREVDPEAVIAGPAEWGWSAFLMSAKDLAMGWLARPDRRMHGDTPLLAWYLQKLAEHEKKTGQRLLDVVDVHFYPQAANVYGKDAKTDKETSALRLRSTRALWDPVYKDESWIDDTIRLIPRVKDWIAQNYPGRGISLGEWSFGAEQHISGGLAIAEALGRFGQHGLTSAFYWDRLEKGTPGYWGFRAFRNYDGRGAHFLEWSLPTKETNDVSLFASRDEGKTKLVAVLVNRDPTFAYRATLDVGSCGAPGARRVFTYEANTPGFAEQKVASGGAVEALVPPYGIAVLELALGR
ncbi:MAG TPA: glycoside hydrolase family 44 protein, partial [Polyangiaceae bacterium]